MERHEIETINDLLEFGGYPVAYIAGYQTRIVKYTDKTFETLGKDVSTDKYTISLYKGESECSAVWAFIEHEIE